MKKITWSEDNCQHSGQLITDLGEYKIISCDLCGFICCWSVYKKTKIRFFE